MTEGNSVYSAFVEFVKDQVADADQHYVTKNVYFFKDTSDISGEAANENGSTGNAAAEIYLVNRGFHTAFYTGMEDESGFTEGTAAAYNPVQGFEEILEYIRSENQYRSIGSANTDSSGSSETSGNETGSGFVANKVDLLTMEISQARAVE